MMDAPLHKKFSFSSQLFLSCSPHKKSTRKYQASYFTRKKIILPTPLDLLINIPSSAVVAKGKNLIFLSSFLHPTSSTNAQKK